MLDMVKKKVSSGDMTKWNASSGDTMERKASTGDSEKQKHFQWTDNKAETVIKCQA